MASTTFVFPWPLFPRRKLIPLPQSIEVSEWLRKFLR
jgi:hypothetical protein